MLNHSNDLEVEKDKVFNDKVNRIVLSTNDDKIMQLISSTKRHVYETNKEIIHRKEKLKCNNVIKQYEKRLTMTMLQKKT